ncbi:MAG: FtsX-like permease family protein [Bifidobacterium psychraerophilum]
MSNGMNGARRMVPDTGELTERLDRVADLPVNRKERRAKRGARGKGVLWQDIFRSFKHSIGRFVSIVLLIALGSFALVGLSVTGPDMRATGNEYFSGHHLADISVISDFGLSDTDQQDIDTAPGASAIEYGYFKDVVRKGSDTSFRLFSAPQTLSTYELVDGRMPGASNEIAVDSTHQDSYPIGSTIAFTEKKNAFGKKILKRTTFKVVGIVKSTEIISRINMGSSTAGSGSLEGYAVISRNVFDSDVYTIARLSYKDLDSLSDHYSKEYKERLQRHKERLDAILAGRPSQRLQEIKSQLLPSVESSQRQVDAAKRELSDSKQQLQDAQSQLAEGSAQITAAQTQLSQKSAAGQAQLLQAQADLSSKQAQFNVKQREYDSAADQVHTAQQQIDSSASQIAQANAAIQASQSALDIGKQTASTAVAQAKTAKQANDREITQTQDALNKATDAEQKAKLAQQLAELQVRNAALEAQVSATQSAYDTYMQGSYATGSRQIQSSRDQLDAKQTQLTAAQSELATKQSELAAAKQQLDSAQAQLDAGQAQIDQGKATLAQQEAAAQNSIDDAKSTLQAKQQEYDTKKKAYDAAAPAAQRKIDEAQSKIDEATAQINALDQPVYSLDSRRETPGSEGYKIYDSVSNIVDSLAKIFPYFMYFVAAMVAFTTMTRFVDEERINAGTLKALGYSNADVRRKFVTYGAVAASIGAVIGIVAGHTLLPLIVYNAYGHNFDIPRIELHFHLGVTVLAACLAMIAVVVPAFAASYKELRDKPAVLMIPKPPSKGSKILLERIPLIWNRMSFTHKVTARNIFRYKQRMFMTIFGVAGSVAMLMAGFAVQGSVSKISESQYGSIIKYDMIVAENKRVTDDQQTTINGQLKSDAISTTAEVRYDTLTKAAGANNDKQSITMIVPKSGDNFSNYFNLTDAKTGESYSLDGDGAVISQRLANVVGVKTGDTLKVTDSTGRSRSIRISGICKMYMGHFIFMGPQAYQSTFGQEYTTNAYLVKLKHPSIENTRKQAAAFMSIAGVKGVSQNTTLISQISTIVDSLNKIMSVLILVAALLGVVILYNLTNLNVAERIRELSTIKVLGFYEKEVTLYIYRETILLSGIGILVGYALGDWLHQYIITAVPPDDVMFNPDIIWQSYVWPLVLVALVTAALGVYVNTKLKHVDMLEALKSVE